MKKLFFALTLSAATTIATAEVFEFDISPIGTSPGVGLSPSNQLHAVVDSTGSGDEILSGIAFDTETMILDLAVGYGSIALFDDLTGPATAVHIHGPAAADQEGPVIVDLNDLGLHVPAGDDTRGGIIFGSIILDETTSSNLMAGLTYINIHTELNSAGEIRGQLIPDFTRPPTITGLTPLNLECTSEDGAVGVLTVEVADPDNDPLMVVWNVDGTDFQTNYVAEGESAAGVMIQFRGSFGQGTHEVTVTATDDDGEMATDMTTVTVVDTTPPEIVSIKATPNTLWPPNHRLRPVRVNVEATDACSRMRARVLSVTSNERVNGQGDGNTRPDYRVLRAPLRPRHKASKDDYRMVSPLRVLLRAERSGKGSGRVYTLEVQVKDAAGNSSTGTVEVIVPHDRGNGKPKSPPKPPKGKDKDKDKGNGKKPNH